MYSTKKLFKVNANPHQCLFNSGSPDITKTTNTPTYFTHIVMQIMHEIFLTGAMSHQQLTYSMVPSFTGAPRNNLRLAEAFTVQKQEPYTPLCYIKTVLERFIDQLVYP